MKQEKLILLFLLCLLSDTLCAKVQTDELCRQSINFNRNWKYMQGDYTGAERTDYDDSSWENNWNTSFLQYSLFYVERLLYRLWLVQEVF